jgi:hypothetical protein
MCKGLFVNGNKEERRGGVEEKPSTESVMFNITAIYDGFKHDRKLRIILSD